MGTGDPDLYKAFSWRLWGLASENAGKVGVVLPRIALSSKGSESFRKVLFSQASEVNITILYNRSFWVFDIANRKAIALIKWEKGNNNKTKVYFHGPYSKESKKI